MLSNYIRYLLIVVLSVLLSNAKVAFGKKPLSRKKSSVSNVFTMISHSAQVNSRNAWDPQCRLFTKLSDFIKKIRMGKAPDVATLVVKNPSNMRVNCFFDVYKGIVPVTAHRIAIYSRGYIPWATPRSATPRHGGGVHWVNRLSQHDILVGTPWVTFDYIDDAVCTDFGQSLDWHNLKSVVDSVKHTNPHAQITLVGDCRGAHAILRYLAAHNDPVVDTIILESPYVQVAEIISTMADSYVKPYLGSYAYTFFNNFFHWYYPRYNRDKDTFITELDRIVGKKIFIGHHLHDRVISENQALMLIKALSKSNDVYFFATASSIGDHCRLSRIPAYQEAVNAFCARYGMMHNVVFAQAGSMLLDYTKAASTILCGDDTVRLYPFAPTEQIV